MFFKWIKKFNKSGNIINYIFNIINYKIRSNQLLADARTLNSPLTSNKTFGSAELIVSFTTYSKRIHDVHLVIESISQQTLKPNRLILWLDEKEYSLDTIPLILKRQTRRGLDIRFCPNYRSYKKLIPTLKEFPEANVITIDDDVLYPYDMVEMLYKEHLQYPECIIGHKVHQLKFNRMRQLLPYKEWEHGIEDSTASLINVAIGIGGVFYPANSLDIEVFNIDKFTQLAPFADDIWFKAMSLKAGRKHKKVADERIFKGRFLVIKKNQDIALFNSNLNNNENDIQIDLVFKYYSLYNKLFLGSNVDDA